MMSALRSRRTAQLATAGGLLLIPLAQLAALSERDPILGLNDVGWLFVASVPIVVLSVGMLAVGALAEASLGGRRGRAARIGAWLTAVGFFGFVVGLYLEYVGGWSYGYVPGLLSQWTGLLAAMTIGAAAMTRYPIVGASIVAGVVIWGLTVVAMPSGMPGWFGLPGYLLVFGGLAATGLLRWPPAAPPSAPP